MAKKREVILKRFLDESGAQTRERQRLLGEIASEISKAWPNATKGSPLVISYFVDYRYGMLHPQDAVMLEDVLQARGSDHNLYLIVDGPGGFGLAAEQVVNVCRTYGSGGFTAIVPKTAKSACSVICMGADRIVMGPAAELGPIDPQVRQPDGKSFSADSYVERYKKTLRDAENTKGNIEPFLMGLKSFDPVLVEEMEREIALSRKIAEDVLFTGMWKGKKRTRQLSETLAVFTSPSKKGSHGRAILFPELKEIGLEVEQIPPDTDLWGCIWELYNRTQAMFLTGCSNLIETADVSFTCPRGRSTRGDENKT